MHSASDGTIFVHLTDVQAAVDFDHSVDLAYLGNVRVQNWHVVPQGLVQIGMLAQLTAVMNQEGLTGGPARVPSFDAYFGSDNQKELPPGDLWGRGRRTSMGSMNVRSLPV
jgi:hypothetical protein